MSSNKVKGLLKGLRYISQIFDSEKEQEIQIGLPTDVKHVAHIGWDGPSVNSPSWMNEFKSTPGGAASTPLSLTGDAQSDNSVKWASDDSRRSSKSARDLPDLPRASRRQTNGTDSPTRERTRPRKSSNKQSNLRDSSSDAGSSNSTQQLNLSSELLQGNGSPAQPSSPRKTRRKKSKENSSSASGPSKTRSKAQLSDPTLDFESPRKSGPKSRNKPRSSFEEDEHARETTMIS